MYLVNKKQKTLKLYTTQYRMNLHKQSEKSEMGRQREKNKLTESKKDKNEKFTKRTVAFEGSLHMSDERGRRGGRRRSGRSGGKRRAEMK